jgi:hypothetical protein
MRVGYSSSIEAEERLNTIFYGPNGKIIQQHHDLLCLYSDTVYVLYTQRKGELMIMM